MATPSEDSRHRSEDGPDIDADTLRRGIRASRIGAEDWGWMVELQHDALPLWIGCGNVDGEHDAFLCCIEPARPGVRRWFRRIDTRVTVARLADALEAALRVHPGGRELEWVQ